MEYIALKTFGGQVSGKRGKPLTIKDKEIAKDLLNAGYIKPLKPIKRNAKVKGKETAG